MPTVLEHLTTDAAREHVTSLALRDAPLTGLVGLELEGHLVDLDRPGERPGWERITAAVAGLQLPHGSPVTLEPGGQVEVSSLPQPGIAAAVAATATDHQALRTHLRAHRLGLALLGADPARPVRRGHPGPRYVAMDRHFRAAGTGGAGLAMMCSTSSLQLNLDAGPEAGWADRAALTHALGPAMVAISACSPLLAGRVTGWASSRMRVWDELDHARSGPLLGGDDPAGEWAAYALMAPVMLVRDSNGEAEPVLRRVPFGAWVAGDVSLGGRRPTSGDLDYHLTTLFPPVRPRGFLEIRYLDATPTRWWPAVAATLATLLEVPAAADLAREASAPVARSWTVAARAGLADQALHRAAVSLLEIACNHVVPELNADVQRLAALVESGRSPGSEVLDAALANGPLAVLATEADR